MMMMMTLLNRMVVVDAPVDWA